MLCRFGVLNKVAMLFESAWWGPHDTFGHVADAQDGEQPGWCYLWYTYPQGISGAPLSLACSCSLQLPGSVFLPVCHAMHARLRSRATDVPGGLR